MGSNRYRRGGDAFHRRNEAVTPPRKRFDKARIFRRISQRFADLVDGGVQIMIDVDEGLRPQPLLQLFPVTTVPGCSNRIASTWNG